MKITGTKVILGTTFDMAMLQHDELVMMANIVGYSPIMGAEGYQCHLCELTQEECEKVKRCVFYSKRRKTRRIFIRHKEEV